MATKSEIGCGLFAVACFAGALDAWFDLGVVNGFATWLKGNVGAGSPSSAPTASQSTHASLFLAAGLAAAGLGLSQSDLLTRFRAPHLKGTTDRTRRPLIAAIVYVARCCDGTMPRDVAAAYFDATGEVLDRGDISKAISYLRSRRGDPLARLLRRVDDDSEKRRILSAACGVWFTHGADSERATRAIERVAAGLGLEGNAINTALDTPRVLDASRVLRNVETFARRTVSRATTEARRISTRIRGTG